MFQESTALIRRQSSTMPVLTAHAAVSSAMSAASESARTSLPLNPRLNQGPHSGPGSFDVAQEFTVGGIHYGLQSRRKTSALLHFQAPNVNPNATSGLVLGRSLYSVHP